LAAKSSIAGAAAVADVVVGAGRREMAPTVAPAWEDIAAVAVVPYSTSAAAADSAAAFVRSAPHTCRDVDRAPRVRQPMQASSTVGCGCDS